MQQCIEGKRESFIETTTNVHASMEHCGVFGLFIWVMNK